jgi:peptidoglycan/xylan/chitin deacetylase (PgdA/CDA1 family)
MHEARMREKVGCFMEKQVIFFGACYYCGLMKLGRWLIRRSGQRLIILIYHRASEGDLHRHLLYFRRHYRMLHLEEALEELYTPAEERKRKQLRDRRTPMVLTFDDGYHDNYTHAFPLACKLKVPITIFLNPAYIENERYFWWTEGDYLVQHAAVDQVMVDGMSYQLDQPEGRKALTKMIFDRSCHAKSVAEREAFLEMMREVLEVPSAVPPGEEVALRWAEIQEMQESGWVSFGGHTMHHPVLGYLADPVEVEREVIECRRVIEQQLGHPVRTFAYPFGKAEHYGEEGLRAVGKAGFSWALTTIYGINTPQSDPLQLHRVVGEAGRHWLLVAARISGLDKVFSPLFPYGRAILAAEEEMATSLRRLVSSWYRQLKEAKS